MVYFFRLLHPLSSLPLPSSSASIVHRFPSLHVSDPFLQIVFPIYFSFLEYGRLSSSTRNIFCFFPVPYAFLFFVRRLRTLPFMTFSRRTDKPLGHPSFSFCPTRYFTSRKRETFNWFRNSHFMQDDSRPLDRILLPSLGPVTGTSYDVWNERNKQRTVPLWFGVRGKIYVFKILLYGVLYYSNGLFGVSLKFATRM